jgi:hypothetical protein
MSFPPLNDTQWVYDITAIWEATIGKNASQVSVHNSGAYAAVHPGTNLKIISMNTILYVSLVFKCYSSFYSTYVYDSINITVGIFNIASDIGFFTIRRDGL